MISKTLTHEKILADAIVKVMQSPEGYRAAEDILDRVRMDEAGLLLARRIFHEIGVKSAYDAVLDNVVEDARIEQMIAAQHPKAAEAVRKLRIEFKGLPVDGLKALRLLINAAIDEKGG